MLNQLVEFVKNNEFLVFMILLLVYFIIRNHRAERLEVGGEPENGGETSIATSGPVVGGEGGEEDTEKNAYELQRDVVDPQLKRESGIRVWKEVVGSRVDRVKRKVKKEDQSEMSGDQIAAVIKIREAEPDLEGIQTNWLSQE